MGIFKSVVGKLRGGLTRTRETVGRLGQQLRGRRPDAEVLQQVERCLIEADVGVQTSVAIVADVRQAWQQGQVAEFGHCDEDRGIYSRNQFHICRTFYGGFGLRKRLVECFRGPVPIFAHF